MPVTTTQAAVLFEIDKPLEIIDLSLPPLKPGQVLVEIAVSGVCHSQLNEWKGLRGPDKFLPHCLGHEGAGTVVSIGDDVAKVKAGDRVVLSWIKGQGKDVPGTVYESSRGKVNSGAIATFMRHTVTCENRLTVIPEDMPFTEAALLGCAIPTGAGVVFNTAQIKPGKSVAIFGVGGIGLSALMGAKAAGAGKIIAVDVIPEKLAKAKEMGATDTVDGTQGNVLDAIRALTEGKGVDVAIEAAGRVPVMETAFESVRNGGGLCVLAGNPPAGETLRLNPFSLIAGKRIQGTWGGESAPDRDLPKFIGMFRDGKLPLGRLLGEVYSLDRINEAMTSLAEGKALRPIIDMRR